MSAPESQGNPGPRFPGYREMGELEMLADEDMVLPIGSSQLIPTIAAGELVGQDVGRYFRPIAPTPAKECFPACEDGSHPCAKHKDPAPSNMWKVDPRPLMAEIESLRAQLDASQARVQALMGAVEGARAELAAWKAPGSKVGQAELIGALLLILESTALAGLKGEKE